MSKLRSLNDSAIYRELAYNSELQHNLKNIGGYNSAISKEKIEDSVNTITKKFNFEMKSDVLNAYNKGNIQLIRNIDFSLPRFLNVIGKKVNGKPVVYVDITPYAKEGPNNTLDVFPRTLYGLMQNGFVLYSYITRFDKISRSVGLAKYGSAAYSKLVCTIMDKILGINIRPARSDIAYFLVNKFFLLNVMNYEADEKTINDMAYNNTINKTNIELLKEMEGILNRDKLYEDIFSFFLELNKLEGFKSLNIRSYIEQYLRMYGEASMLSLDYFPSFISMILGTNVTANINKDFIIDSICSKDSRYIVSEFAKLI